VNDQPKVVFAITCKNRAQHLKLTLPVNLAHNRQAKFVILDYNSEDDLREYVRTSFGKAIHKGRLAIYHYRTPGPFKMAHAKNMAHRLGILEGGDILVNLDADNYTGPNFDEYLLGVFAMYSDVFMWACMVKGEMSRGISGRIAVRATDFLKVGGYDERFETWSPDDKDFHRRLRLLGLNGFEIDRRFLDSVRHTEKMRFREYPHAAKDGYSHSYLGNDSSPIVNFGRIGCGIVFRNFDFCDPLALEPLPTRIFGIGMHKTATTSLYHAFKILGIDAAHWKSAHWAKAIWREMNELGRSLTLEKSYALCDLPITMLYRKLDVGYPGSKFILTTRDEAGWLATVRKHWDPEHNPFRAGWDTDPFTNRCHRALYGREDFDWQTMLERYRRHNGEVEHYFRKRPKDLLVMNMDEGAGWEELCGFLGTGPAPHVPYPRAFAAY
jgi:Sulfotransferase domain/N-terminal domain of galactosyltransferase